MLKGTEEDRLSSYTHVLVSETLEVHVNPALCFVISRHVAESAEVEVRTKLPVETGKEVQVERGGHAVGVVIRQLKEIAVLLEVVANKERIAFLSTPENWVRSRRASGGSKLPMLDPA